MNTAFLTEAATFSFDWNSIVNFLTGKALPVAFKVIIALVIYFIGTRLIKACTSLTKKALEKAKVDAGVQSFLMSMVRIVLFIALFLVILGYFGFQVTSLAALVASAGVTVGLALQGSLSNLAGGVLILVLKPFKIGDYIIAQGYEGTVSAIEIFYTTLSTGDNKRIVLPNGALSNGNIVNVSHQEYRRLDLVFGVSYNADVKKVKEILTTLGEEHELVEKDRGVTVFINEFAASSIDFGFRVWTKSANYWTLKWDLMEKVKEAFDANGIEIPFNQLDVHVTNNQ